MDKKFRQMKKIMNFAVFTYKFQKISQSQLNFAQSHDGEMVTFRNSASKKKILSMLHFTETCLTTFVFCQPPFFHKKCLKN